VVPSLYELTSNLFFLQGITSPYINTNPIVWTLTVEVFFYCLAPLLTKSSRAVLVMLTISGLSFLMYRKLSLPYYSTLLYGLNILFLGWPWLSGFWFYKNRNQVWAIFVVATLGISLISYNGQYLENLWAVTWMVTCGVLGYGHLVPRSKASVVCKLAGDASYPLYLVHIPAYLVFFQTGVPRVGFIYFFSVSILALLIDKYIDKPMKTILKRSMKFLSTWTIVPYRVGPSGERGREIQ
jgi:peptidoglycan/LPS O-acetylase OafA/YrhL